MKRVTEHLENLVRINDPNSGKEILKEFDHIEQKFKDYRNFLSRGGFIKDRNGKWCKEGDTVKIYDVCAIVKWYENEHEFRFVLSSENFFKGVSFELIEPCEPDVCKDFEI